MDYDFESLELFYLRRLIAERIGTLQRSLEKNRRFFRDTDDDILWQKKVSNLEVEISCLENAKTRINMQIAYLDIHPVSTESG